MGKRKIILLFCAVFLLAVYILQLATGNKNTVKELTLSEEITSIALSSKESGEISLTSENGSWLIGKYKANESKVNQILEQIKKVKILDTVSSSASDLARYGLDEENIITVKAFAGEKELRTLEIGKASVTGGQTYIRLDSSKAVLLASGSLGALFSSTREQLRDNDIYSRTSSDIKSIATFDANGEKMFELERGEAGEDGASEWQLLGESEKKLDSAKVASWVSSLSNLMASEWSDESDKSPLLLKRRVEIKTENKNISVLVSEKGDDSKYTAESSETPYRFKISSYAGDSFTKELADLLKE